MTGNTLKTIVTIGILVALVGGITFVTQYVPSKERPDVSPAPPPGPERGLVFPKSSNETLYSETTPATGFCEYLFTNEASVTMELGLDFQNCKCAGVQVRNLNREEKETYLSLTHKGCVAQTLAAPPQPLSVVAVGAALHDKLQGILGPRGEWLQMTAKKETLIVPAEGSGLARLRWEGKQEGPQRLKATFWSRPLAKPTQASFTDIELPMVYVPPLGLAPPEGDVKELVAGGKNGVGFICYSATRPDFTLSAHEENHDPCFEVTCEPRSVEQLNKDLAALGTAFPIVKGYLIWVWVHENRNGKQLDFGPFQRRIAVKSDALLETAVVVVKGIVASDLRVVGDKQNRISLAQFDADRGATKHVLIESDRPGLRLALDSRSPQIMSVTLSDPKPTSDGGQQWKLEIVMPPNSINGRMPPDSEIVLKTLDGSPRRFRIPVAGEAVIR